MPEEPEKVDLTTPDLAAEKRAIVEELLPGVIADGVVDATRLGELLDLDVSAPTDGRERYGLQWAGKQDAIRSLLTGSRSALIPEIEKSRDFDSATNVFIEGDNLEVLKLLQKAYNDEIKLIYIDPPYNTRSDFVYQDDHADPTREYLARTGQLDAYGDRTSSTVEATGRLHSRWLSMMFPRLLLARNLLTRDGLIMVHIDEHEQPRLRLLMDEVFGPENNLGEVIWDKRNPKGDATGISSQHEYLLVYARSKEEFIGAGGFRKAKAAAGEILDMADRLWSSIGQHHLPADLANALHRHGISEETVSHLARMITPDMAREFFSEWLKDQPFTGGERAYNRIDDAGEVYRLVSMAWPSKKRAPDEYFIPLQHPESGKDCPVPARGWRNPPATMKRLLEQGRIVFGRDETTQPQCKYLLREHMGEGLASVVPFGGSDDRLLAELDIPFDTPKPVDLIRPLIESCTGADDVIMDFFSGSGSTAHAVAHQNERDGARRRWICVNYPEPTAPNSEARRAGIETVSEITLRRLLAVADNIPSAKAQGLRVFSIGPSNFRQEGTYDEPLTLDALTLVEGAAGRAIAAEVLLAEGIRLDEPWQEVEVAGTRAVVADRVGVMLAKTLTHDIVDAALDLDLRVAVFLEDAFAGADAVKSTARAEARALRITMKTV